MVELEEKHMLEICAKHGARILDPTMVKMVG